jgi:hypothetical protein
MNDTTYAGLSIEQIIQHIIGTTYAERTKTMLNVLYLMVNKLPNTAMASEPNKINYRDRNNIWSIKTQFTWISTHI